MPRILQKYSLAVFMVLAVFALQFALGRWWGNATLPLLAPTLLLVSWLFGFGPGNLANFLGTLGAAFFYFSPHFSVTVEVPEERHTLVTFALSVFIINVLIEMRRRSERAFKKSEKQFRWLADSMPQLVWITDLDGNIEYMNRRWFEYTGQVPDDRSLETIWLSTMHPDDRERVLTSRKKALLNGDGFQVEYRVRRFDGEYHWHLSRSVYARDDSGRPVKRFGTATDIHEKKLALQQADAAVTRLRLITDRLPALVTYMGLDRKYQFVNEQFLKASFLTEDQVIGRTRKEVFANDEIYEIARAHEERALAGEESSFPLRYHARDGVFHCIDVSFRPDFDEHGKVRGMVSVAHDVSERERAYQKVENAVKAREEFMSMASHELRTPLTGMKLHTQLMQRHLKRGPEEPLPRAVVEKYVTHTDQSLDRMVRLVEDMLDIARIQAGKLELHREKSDVVEVVAETLNRFSDELAGAGIETTFDAPKRLELPLDKFRIEQVVSNLVTNAIRYAPRAPVEVKIRESDGKAIIVFSDNGPGIAAPNRERVFDRFERLYSARSIKGLGLGLYIVKEIVDAHGGKISIENAKRRGASFVIELPTQEGAA